MGEIQWTDEAETVDHDEYGRPVRDEYRRLGASGRQEGIYVRFEPGFGLNVHIGRRIQRFEAGYGRRPQWGDHKDREFVMGIGEWEQLVALVDEWRERQPCDHPTIDATTLAERDPRYVPACTCDQEPYQ